MKLLVTTALEETWDEDQSMIFLGEWCKKYSRKNFWEKLNYEVFPYHWDDRKKLKNNHDYLELLYERVLESLTVVLNRIHGLKKSLRYWRIILGPWLLTFLPVLYDRWTLIELVLKNDKNIKTKVYKFNKHDFIIRDYHSLNQLVNTDIWNYKIFCKIIQNLFDESAIEYINSSNIEKMVFDYNNYVPLETFRLKDKLLLLIDSILTKLSFLNNKVFFYNSYFRVLQYLHINFLLFQIPIFYLRTFNRRYSRLLSFSKERDTMLQFTQNSKFESFVASNLMQELPISALENFETIVKHTNMIKNNANLIVTANGHFTDDTFKIWLANELEKSKKLFIVDHGGSIPPKFDYFSHDEKIANHRITWFQTLDHRHKRLPPSKLIGFKIKSRKLYCSLIGLEMPRYSYRATAYPIAGQSLDCYNLTVDFIKSLSPIVYEKLMVKPYIRGSWETEKRYKDLVGESKVYKEVNYYKVLKRTKLVVCTYLDTTFSEAMVSGLPTIVLHKSEYFEKIPESEEIIQILVNSNIIFVDPILAACHINNVWDHLDEWWNQKNVQDAKKSFFNIAIDLNGNPLKKWVSFLNNSFKNSN